MRMHLQIPEEQLSRFKRGITRLPWCQGPLAWSIIALMMVLFFMPYAFTDTINKALGAISNTIPK